jgi:hypothetical protein
VRKEVLFSSVITYALLLNKEKTEQEKTTFHVCFFVA